MDQPRLIHQGAARNRRQRIFLSNRCDLATFVGMPATSLLRRGKPKNGRSAILMCSAWDASRSMRQPRRTNGPDAAGPSPFEARFARTSG
ncbi:hypothetical protein BJS_01797 [Bradyrhizobium japonicum SEMIA 5079]|nr:hypothetical protein BJS_01797 [Bradyrhizobium japonicum SEMIA 5079]